MRIPKDKCRRMNADVRIDPETSIVVCRHQNLSMKADTDGEMRKQC